MKTIIKMLRAKDGLIQADLAKRAGVRRETIIFVETVFIYEDEKLVL